MSPAAQSVIDRLDAARQRWWLFTSLSTAVLALATSFGLLVAFMLSDALLHFSQIALGLLLAVWLMASALLVWLVGRRLAGNQRTLEATARRVEAELPQLGSDLMNLVQLAGDTKNVDRAFCQAAVDQAAARLRHVHFDDAAAARTAGGGSATACKRPATWANRSACWRSWSYWPWFANGSCPTGARRPAG